MSLIELIQTSPCSTCGTTELILLIHEFGKSLAMLMIIPPHVVHIKCFVHIHHVGSPLRHYINSCTVFSQILDYSAP